MNTLILLGALAAGQPQPQLQPVLHCPAPVAAKGDVKAGPPLVHTFELTNATAGTVTITKVEAGCGCLRQGLVATALRPGAATKLALEVNTLMRLSGTVRFLNEPVRYAS